MIYYICIFCIVYILQVINQIPEKNHQLQFCSKENRGWGSSMHRLRWLAVEKYTTDPSLKSFCRKTRLLYWNISKYYGHYMVVIHYRQQNILPFLCFLWFIVHLRKTKFSTIKLSSFYDTIKIKGDVSKYIKLFA